MTVDAMKRQALGVHPITGMDCWWAWNDTTRQWEIVE